MKPHSAFDSSHTPTGADVGTEGVPTYGRLPNRLLTAFEVAEFVADRSTCTGMTFVMREPAGCWRTAWTFASSS